MGARDSATSGSVESDEGEFQIEEVIAADGEPARREELILRLQTLKSQKDYWLDTGIFSVV